MRWSDRAGPGTKHKTSRMRQLAEKNGVCLMRLLLMAKGVEKIYCLGDLQETAIAGIPDLRPTRFMAVLSAHWLCGIHPE